MSLVVTAVEYSSTMSAHEAVRRLGVTSRAVEFGAHDGLAASTYYDLDGGRFLVDVRSDECKFLRVDASFRTYYAGDLTTREAEEFALVSTDDARAARCAATWYTVIQGAARQTIDRLYGVRVAVREKLTIVLYRAPEITVAVATARARVSATAPTDSVADVLSCVAGLLHLTVDELLATFHVPGVRVTAAGAPRG